MSRVCLLVDLLFVCLLFCCLFIEAPVLGTSVSPPEENVWVKIASMRHARSYFGTAVADGKIYAIGGLDKQGVIGIVERYDPQTNTWVDMSSMPTPRYRYVIACSMGKIYCIGGSDTNLGSFTGVNEAYDPITDSWEKKVSMPTPRADASVCVLNGSIYVMGGTIITSDGWFYSDLCEVYDPVEDAWSVYDGPWPKVPSASMVFDNRQYVCDGFWLQIYDFVGDSWMAGPDVPLGLYGRGVVAVDGLLYALGGCNEMYSFPFYMWSPERVPVRSCFVYTPFGYGRVAPEISVLSLEEGGRYDFGTPVSLEFSLSQPVVWLGYCLDGQANVTIGGNVTLSGLSAGVHNVVVFAEDKFGNVGVSETVVFSVVSEPDPTLSVSVVVVLCVVSVLAVAVLFLFLRRRRSVKPLQMG